MDLLANLEDLLWPVNARSIILGIFDPFSTSRYGILLGVLNYCWSKQTLLKFEFFVAPLEAGSWITSEIGDPYIYGPYLTWGTYWCSMEKFILFSGAMLGSWCWVSLGSFSQYRVNQVSLRSIFSDAPLCELRCTRSIQFGVIVPYLMNGTAVNSSSNTTWNLVKTWKIAGFRTRDTNPAWTDEWTKYIPAREQVYHLSNPTIFPWNIASKTKTGQLHLWWFLREIFVVVPTNFSPKY